MRDWNLELKTLEQQKQNEIAADRLALVKDEVNELSELEKEFTISGTYLNQYKQDLVEVTERTQPEIERLTQTFTELKSAINEIDTEMFLQGVVIENTNLGVVRQQNLCSALFANKDADELEFASYMSAKQTLIESQQKLQTEKEKLKTLTERFYRLKAVPNIATLDRKIRELKAEGLTAQNRVSNVEQDIRAMNTRMMFLRATIAKNGSDKSYTSR